MALSDDQRAMLQLLLQRGQSYEDIGALLGLEVDQVRSRARGALTEIAGEDPDRDVGLTDYLLGQADPIGRADAARQLQSDGHVHDLAERLATQLRVLAPGAELPELPGANARPAKRSRPKDAEVAPAPSRSESDSPGVDAPAESSAARRSLASFTGTLTQRQRQVIAALLGGGALLVVIVLIATGVFDGGKSSNDSGSSSNSASSGQGPNASGLTRAVLTPQNGSKAQGVAVFTTVRNVPVMVINVTNLQPSPSGQGYLVWLYGGPAQALPLVSAPQKVGKSGQLKGQAPLRLTQTALAQALRRGFFRSVDVSLVTNAQLKAAVNGIRRNPRQPLHYFGRSVARGTVTGPGFPASGSGGTSGG